MIAVARQHFGVELDDARGQANVVRVVGPAERAFVFHVDAHLVGHVQQRGQRGIMRGADRIEIGLLDQQRVPPFQISGDRPAQQRVLIVVAGAADFYGSAVDEQLPAADVRSAGSRSVASIGPPLRPSTLSVTSSV